MRRYNEPVDVRRRDDTPEQFLWRGRLYVIRNVCATWVEAEPWWLTPAARALYGQTADGVLRGPGATVTPPFPAPVSETAELEMWRVEASSGRSAASGVFDLCYDWSAGVWKLAQVVD